MKRVSLWVELRRWGALMSVGGWMLLAGTPGVQAAERTAGSVRPVNLTCEYLVNPLGLDMARPRLSWQLEATDPEARGQRQTAWRIQVAGDAARLAAGKADLWDSGWRFSPQSRLVPYGGRPLRNGLVCHWRVRVRDEEGRESAWSEPARWSMGPMNVADWEAEWIGTGEEFRPEKGVHDNTLPDPWLRRTFTLKAKPVRAVIYVASVGYHEVHVNGHKAGDAVLMPPVSDHTRRARYCSYDITALLHAGRNTLGLWLGASWSLYPLYRTPDKPAAPIVLAQADCWLPDGSRQRVVTDGSWKWHPGPSTTLGVWKYGNYGGELVEAGKENPRWATPEDGDAGWSPVRVFHPRLKVTAAVIEPNRLQGELKPVALTEPRPGVWRVDLGRNFAGWIEARFHGQPGDRITLKFSERKEKEMTYGHHGVCVLGPDGKGVFRHRFNYAAARWVQIEGLRARPSLGDFRGWPARTDYRRVTRFACSDDLLNRIYETVLWTFENLSLGGYVVDCAQRERMGYGGDAHATTLTGMDNYALGAFYTKWAQDWRDTQAPVGGHPGFPESESPPHLQPGELPHTAPTYWGGGGPGWGGYCVTLPWEFARRYGDRQMLDRMLPTIEGWLAFLETRARDNLLRRWGGPWDFLGDWLWPGAQGVNSDTRESLFFNNCYWIYNLQTAAKIADAAGHPDQARQWRARARQVRAAVHREFFNPADASYVNGLQAYLSLALITHVPPEATRPAVWRRLEREIRVKRKGHFWGGITGGAFVVKNLLDAGRNDLLCLMARQEDYPGWGHMLKQGATTIWEDWEGRLSQSHSSYLHIGAWFIEGLAGIQPGDDADGYQTFYLRPACDGSVPLQWVRCREETTCGVIQSNWRRDGDRVTLDVIVPPNTRALLEVSAGGTLRAANGETGIERLPAEGRRQRLRLAPGHYRFTTAP
jgi:alpha-L-rhamnosidase